MRAFVLPLVGTLCFASLKINCSSATESDPYQTISHQQIAATLSSLTFQEQQEFCDHVDEARAFIEVELNYHPSGEEYQGNITDIKDLLRIFEENPQDFNGLQEYPLAQIDNTFLSLQLYLEFCLALTPSKKMGSFSSYPDKHILQILDCLNREDSQSKRVWPIAEAFRSIFKTPLTLTPFDIYKFELNFKELKDITARKSLEPCVIHSYEWIAEALCAMNSLEIKAFCAEICFIKNEILREISYTPSLTPDNYYYSRRNRELNLTITLLEMFQTFPQDLEPIAQYPLWQIDHTPLTLFRYLEFYVDMNPENQYQEWVPFLRKERYLGVETLLNHLELNPQAQYSSTVRETLNQLTDSFQNPLRLSPLKIFDFQLILQDLQEKVSQYKYKTTYGCMKEFICSRWKS